ncbi:MAG: sulfatase-like hydrolase/transferase [Selenomonadaceae bacterium]|nr:sulfatase-like hydrolase/transferase [Selenomonadaceae bacterium]
MYNDFIVNEIIRRFEEKDAVIIYISDHGEEVFENGREFAGHSMEESGNRNMIEIPAIIWASKKFRQSYPEKISALNAALDRPYRTDYLIHALLDLLDIRTTSFEPEKSILNARFDSSLPRIYNQQPYIKDE